MLSYHEWAKYQEIFNTPLGKTKRPLISPTTYSQTYHVQNVEYFFVASKAGALYPGKDGGKVYVNVWSVVFSNESVDQDDPDLGFGLTGEGNPLQVFSATFEVLKSFIANKNPDVIKFSAKEMSRRLLYTRMIQRYAQSIGYVPYKNPVTRFSTDSVFELVRADVYEKLAPLNTHPNPLMALRQDR